MVPVAGTAVVWVWRISCQPASAPWEASPSASQAVMPAAAWIQLTLLVGGVRT